MSARDSLAFLRDVALPTWAKGVIVRRPAIVRLAARLDLDRRAIQRMQALRERYGRSLILVRNPFRLQAIILAAEDVRRVLDGAPEPFSPASSEKRAALSHFEPDVSLITTGTERAERRAFSDAALESSRPVHSWAGAFLRIVEEETEVLLRDAGPDGTVDWPQFSDVWFRVVRRVVLGSDAREDRDLTDELTTLRSRANWAFAVPQHRHLRRRFHARLQEYLSRAEPGSLAGFVAARPLSPQTRPSHQVAQWLFAFDPAGMTTFRTLALLAGHPTALEVARRETDTNEGGTDGLRFIRACYVETLRLYPTTPAILRQTTRDTDWPGGVLPAGAGILIYAPFFHRDDERLPGADKFEPEQWCDKDPADVPPFVPFSAGPAACPARNLVPMLGSFMLSVLLKGRSVELLASPKLDSAQPLPGTLDHTSLKVGLLPGARHHSARTPRDMTA